MYCMASPPPTPAKDKSAGNEGVIGCWFSDRNPDGTFPFPLL